MERQERKHYFTVKELSRMGLGSEATIWRRIKNGDLKAIKCGGSVRVTVDALREFESEHALVF